jgi:hypothetical protein
MKTGECCLLLVYAMQVDAHVGGDTRSLIVPILHHVFICHDIHTVYLAAQPYPAGRVHEYEAREPVRALSDGIHGDHATAPPSENVASTPV